MFLVQHSLIFQELQVQTFLVTYSNLKGQIQRQMTYSVEEEALEGFPQQTEQTIWPGQIRQTINKGLLREIWMQALQISQEI